MLNFDVWANCVQVGVVYDKIQQETTAEKAPV